LPIISFSQDIYYLLPGKIACEVYFSTNEYTRVKTAKKIKESDLIKVKEGLKIKTSLVYFNLPNLLNRGEEYGCLTGTWAAVFDDFNESELLRKHATSEPYKPKPKGVDNPDFARKAFITSQGFVKRELPFSKYADFPMFDYKYSKVIDETITIESHVNTKNVAGDKIKLNYVIKMKKIGYDWLEESSWQVLNLKFY
jgi:hypothetical protein